MKSSLNNFNSNIMRFSETSNSLRPSWDDEIGDAFYRDIIQPLKAEAERLEPHMEELIVTLEQLKPQIDAI